MKKIVLSIFAVGALFLAVMAQDQDAEQQKGPCRDDLAKYCKGIKPGGGRIWACLKSNEDRVAPACKEHMAQSREKMKGFHDACKGDIKTLCKGIPHGRGKVVSCLKGNKDRLSEPCKAFFNKN